MGQVLIIPDRNNLRQSLELAEKYKLGFEYNDFFIPDLLDDEEKLEKVICDYQKVSLPAYCTLHGAFFDIIPFSIDAKVREISIQRIEQSIAVAKRFGAKGVVFHTNYNPFLDTDVYVKNWIEQNIQFWSSILEKHSDIHIYLENMFDTTPDIMEVLSEVLCKYENFGVCLDYAHAAISKTPPEIWAKRLGRFVKHVHINDNDLVSDLHLAWGKGKINRADFYECFDTYMKGASVLIETSSFENIKTSIEVFIEEGFLVE